MTGSLGWTVNDHDEHAVVAVYGRLDLRGTPALRTVLLKCLAEQPEALLVELSAVELCDETALSVFTAVSRQAAQWPGTPLLVCAPPPDIAELLERGRYGKLPVYRDLEEGRRAMADGRAVVPSLSDSLFPIPGAIRHARNLATEACATWGLPELIGPASLVASELVTNAIEHAGTMITVQFTRRKRYMHVAVRDGSPVEPVLAEEVTAGDRGRGLKLVDSVATHWGWLPSRDGKVVWATLAA
ncbi:ATP-binding protein [Actinoplanes sp. CA-030573]|uniref:ATP-binding protein n=1 Tax=Actinoplanes sp. CA-030573 TaxID=3239898 RepID=UPI003D8CBC4D